MDNIIIKRRSRKKICLLFCGGTIALSSDKETGKVRPVNNVKELLSLIPEIYEHVDLDYSVVTTLDSTNMQMHNWTELAETIYAKYDDYDGFVVTHGTDTMAYTASALSLALQNLNKPIVLTGAQLPIYEIGSDARSNLLNSIRTATLDIAEVVICFGRRILRGNRSQKSSSFDFDGFHSPQFPECGRIGIDISLADFIRKRSIIETKLVLQSRFAKGIIDLRMNAAMQPELLKSIAESKYCIGMVIQGYGAGKVPNKENPMVPMIDYAINNQNKPVVITTQCTKDRVRKGVYDEVFQPMHYGAISAEDMTYETSLVKLSWCLAQSHDLKRIKLMMHTDYAGEICLEDKPRKLRC